MLIYKLLSEKDYKKFLEDSFFEGSVADNEDGFIHLSTRTQIWETVYKHFNNERNLYIPEITKIINLAKSKDFELFKKINLKSIGYTNEYLYIFKK